jgi:PAS domain S-box-containing protein
MDDLDRFLSAFDLTPLLVAVSDAGNGRTVRLNRNYLATSGFSAEEALGRSFVETGWFSAGDGECVSAALRDRGAARNLEFRCTGAGGRRVWVLCSSQYVHAGGRLLVLSIGVDITERKTAEEAAEEERRRLEDLASNLPGIIFQSRVDDGGGPPQVTYLSRGAKGLFGLEEEKEGYFERFVAAIHDEDRESVLDAVRRAVEEEAPCRYRARLVKPGGEVVWISSQSVPVRVGGTLRYNGLILDVTDQVRVEEGLREAEERFALFLDHLPAGAFLKDGEGRAIHLNRYMRDTFPGWGGALGKRNEELFPGAVGEEMAREDRRIVAEGLPILKEVRLADVRGAERIYQTLKFPVSTASRGVCVGGIAVDVTDRVHAEEALRESEERFSRFFDNFPAVAFLKDDEGVIVLGNRYVKEKVWGRDLTGLSHEEIFPPAEAARVREDDRLASREGFRTFLERVRDFHGEERIFQTTKFVVPSRGGRSLIGGIAVDITDRIRTEEALRESEERLRSLAAHQREVLEEERSRIAREIHDELAQQLTVQRMDLYWLRRRLAGGGHPEEEAKVNEMMEGVERTRKVVDQVIRDLRPPILDDLGMTPALEWLAGQFRARTGIAVSLSVVPKSFPVSGAVGAAVYRIVQEALTNVARHAEAARARVSLRRRGGSLFLSVSDDGRGMEGEGRKGGAAGHGLLGIRERVRAMEGSVEIRSRRGGGTSLAVKIPLENAGGESR